MNLHSFKDKLERVQNEIVKATNMAVVIVDILGRYVTEKKIIQNFALILERNLILISIVKIATSLL
jgi:ligand-binding sensor protein